MTALAANLEWMFGEAGDDIPERIRAAAAADIHAVEIWRWRGRDIAGIARALAETQVRLVSLIVEPQLQLTDPATHADYQEAVTASCAVAQTLGAPFLVAVAGDTRPDTPRADQRSAVVEALRIAAAAVEGTGVTILLENLNDRVDHVGTFVTSVREAIDLVAEVGSPQVKVLLDAYHAAVMDEDLRASIGDDIALIGHVQIADAPGRHEPGSGAADWHAAVSTLRDLGYTGPFGMEYLPTGDTVRSLDEIRSIVARVDAPV